MSAPSSPARPAAMSASSSSKPIYLVSYPKIILLYPTYVMSLLAAIITSMVAIDSTYNVVATVLFLGIMAVNMVVLAFDFPRTTSLTLFFLFMAVGLGLALLFQFYPSLLPDILSWFSQIKPRANSTFYWCFFVYFTIIYVVIQFYVRTDYWEVRPNELLHHHGVLSNLERYPAPNVRISKEISDVFEYMLLGSGRLIIQTTTERRPFILENVPFIDRREAQITRLLGALQVEVRQEVKSEP